MLRGVQIKKLFKLKPLSEVNTSGFKYQFHMPQKRQGKQENQITKIRTKSNCPFFKIKTLNNVRLASDKTLN